MLAALRRYLDDATTFADSFYRGRTFRTQGFVIGAFVRLIGPDRRAPFLKSIRMVASWGETNNASDE